MEEFEQIHTMLELVEVDVTHIYREANQLADNIVNETFKHQGRT